MARSVVEGYLQRLDISKTELSLLFPLMYADVLRSLCWQLQELSSGDSRVQPNNVEQDMQKVLWLGNFVMSGQSSTLFC